jgi:alpha-galactosidase
MDTSPRHARAGREDVSSVVAGAAVKVRIATTFCATLLLAATPLFAQTTRTSMLLPVKLGGFSIEIDGHELRAPALGEGETSQRIEQAGVRIDRRVRSDDSDIRIFTRISNQTAHAVSLGLAKLLEGEWEAAAHAGGSPGADFVANAATLACEPHGPDTERHYAASTVLALALPAEKSALVVGYLTAGVARPDLAATYRPGKSLTFVATQQLLARQLPAGASIDLDVVYVASNSNPFTALDAYGRAAGAESKARTTHATALWCSWYAHRMDVNEELVLANAAVAAKHFKPLGFEFMQLDHGWQTGDITGDWTVDRASFPHGMKWLADELKARYGLKLGLWIAPTDAAETSELFKQHPDWMLKDSAGKPLVNWKWYWKPNPNCYELDTTNPACAKWIEQTFARLSSEGASYYKIDFIASSGGEQFFQSDPTATRGWGNLRRAMEAVRAGAGDEAWIRYCQTPPLLSAHLADSAYGGDDTLDAGVPGTFHVLRDNARFLAAGYWINDRLYHREVCDMSVRMQADVEEARLRLAMMTLAGCSISFSDELQHLPPSRIRMMQQCLPPGAPPMRPIDLFERAVPSIWHVHCKNEADQWDVVGLFNFEESPEPRTVDFAALGLDGAAEHTVLEFWEEKFLGVHKGKFTMTLAPHTSRILAIRRITGGPQVVGTDMHLLQGWHELIGSNCDGATLTLSGRCKRAAGLHGRVFVYVPAAFTPRFDFPLRKESAHLTHVDGPLWARELEFDSAEVDWQIPFTRSP